MCQKTQVNSPKYLSLTYHKPIILGALWLLFKNASVHTLWLHSWVNTSKTDWDNTTTFSKVWLSSINMIAKRSGSPLPLHFESNKNPWKGYILTCFLALNSYFLYIPCGSKISGSRPKRLVELTNLKSCFSTS